MDKNSGKGLNAQTVYRATELFGSLTFVGPLLTRILHERFSKAHRYTLQLGLSECGRVYLRRMVGVVSRS